MFISRERLILKTCGKTTLLYSVEPIIDLVRDECGLDEVIVSIVTSFFFLLPMDFIEE